MVKRLITSFLIILITFAILLPNSIYAIGELISSAENFLEKGNSVDDTINTAALRETSSYIYNAFLAVGISIAVLVGAAIGIKIMASTVEEKAKAKEMLMPFVIGCLVLFSAFTIWKIVIEIGNSVMN